MSLVWLELTLGPVLLACGFAVVLLKLIDRRSGDAASRGVYKPFGLWLGLGAVAIAIGLFGVVRALTTYN